MNKKIILINKMFQLFVCVVIKMILIEGVTLNTTKSEFDQNDNVLNDKKNIIYNIKNPQLLNRSTMISEIVYKPISENINVKENEDLFLYITISLMVVGFIFLCISFIIFQKIWIFPDLSNEELEQLKVL